MASGHLIRSGDIRQVDAACYELRMGTIYYDLTESEKRIDVGSSGKILIKPGHRVVLITLEELAIPNDVIARVVSKGSLFSVGLSPVCTYADPGFEGNIGIVTQNISDKYIELPVGEIIAKVDFTILSSVSTRPYQGQHGFQTQIWPIKHHLQKTYDQVKNDSRVESEDKEAHKLLPKVTSDLLIRMEKNQFRVDVLIIALIFINSGALIAIAGEFVDLFLGIALNLIADFIMMIILFFIRKGN